MTENKWWTNQSISQGLCYIHESVWKSFRSKLIGTHFDLQVHQVLQRIDVEHWAEIDFRKIVVRQVVPRCHGCGINDRRLKVSKRSISYRVCNNLRFSTDRNFLVLWKNWHISSHTSSINRFSIKYCNPYPFKCQLMQLSKLKSLHTCPALNLNVPSSSCK